MRYAIVIEKAATNYAAYVPDLPGCVATGDTPEGPKNLCVRRSNFIWKVYVLTGCLSHHQPAKWNTWKSQSKLDDCYGPARARFRFSARTQSATAEPRPFRMRDCKT